jgi:hypothetical protein
MDRFTTSLPLSSESPLNRGLSQHDLRYTYLDGLAYSGALAPRVSSAAPAFHIAGFSSTPCLLARRSHSLGLNRGIENP